METMSLDLGFGFNDENFSDRILRLAILPDEDDSDDRPSSESRPDKRRKTICDAELQISQGDTSENNETSADQLHYSAFQEKCINVNSLILAGHSPFFHKLFSNGMKESRQQHATIHIQASEEAAFMDLLKYMYSGKLSSATPPELLEVMRIADKFSVASCVKLCSQLLNSLPMTVELALVYLKIDSVSLMVGCVEERIDTAKMFLVEHFKFMKTSKFQEELLTLPLVGVEAVLSSDRLQINSEDDIYDFIQKWVQKHYPDQLEEKRKILNMLLRRFLRFPFISITKLKNIVSCRDIDPDVTNELVGGSLGYHLAQPPDQQTLGKFVTRAYTYLPLKVVAFNSSSCQSSIVYLDLKRDECQNLFHGGKSRLSQSFFLGEHQLFLCADCINVRGQRSRFGIFISSKSVGLTFSCEIASMQKPSKDFVVTLKDCSFTIPEGGSLNSLMMTGWPDLFDIPWATFIGEDSPYFIDDILHLRCQLTILN